jgi:hypothetical protein
MASAQILSRKKWDQPRKAQRTRAEEQATRATHWLPPPRTSTKLVLHVVETGGEDMKRENDAGARKHFSASFADMSQVWRWRTRSEHLPWKSKTQSSEWIAQPAELVGIAGTDRSQKSVIAELDRKALPCQRTRPVPKRRSKSDTWIKNSSGSSDLSEWDHVGNDKPHWRAQREDKIWPVPGPAPDREKMQHELRSSDKIKRENENHITRSKNNFIVEFSTDLLWIKEVTALPPSFEYWK